MTNSANNPHIIRDTLQQIIHSLQQDVSPFVKNPGKDFSRNRAITLEDMVLLLLSLEAHSLNKELHHYFASFKKKVPPYKSAFSQQRAKINDALFPYLLHTFNQKCPFKAKMDGLHVLAGDGSDVNVPAGINDCNTFIPYNSNNGGYHQLHINALFDLYEQRYVDIDIQPRGDINECSAVSDMVERNPLKGQCLYIFDRGYENFNLMAHIMERKDYFLIRAKNVFSSVSPYHFFDLPDSDEYDLDINFLITRSSRKIYREDPCTYKVINCKNRFDFINPDDKESLFPLSFRLVKIRLDNDKEEYLLTNIPRESYGYARLKDLYHMRWQIETSFLFLKYGISLNYFHSVITERQHQEIYAKIILFNFISLMISCVSVKTNKTKFSYKISFSDAIYICREYLLGLRSWNRTVELLLRHKIPIRPGRKAKRNVASQRLKSLQHRS